MTPVANDESLSDDVPVVLEDAIGVVIDDPGTVTRRELRRRRRRRRWGDRGLELLVIILGLGAIAAGFLGFGLNNPTITNKKDEPLNRNTPPSEAVVKPLFTLLVLEGDLGDPAALSILVPEKDRAGGDIVFVPLGIMAEVPSFGLRPLREVPGLGNKDLLAATVSNLLGMTFDAVDTLKPQQLAELIAPLGMLSVELSTSVEVPRKATTTNGIERSGLRVGPGVTNINPDEVFSLFASVPGESELDRIVRHQAIWESWLAKAADMKSVSAEQSQPARVPSAVAALAAGATTFHILPVESISGGTDGSDELFRLRDPEATNLLSELGGSNVSNRISVQLLNGTGDPGLAQYVAPLLVSTGVQVALTGNAARFDHATTTVVYSDPQDLPAAQAVQSALGLGEVVRSRVGVMLVDVTVVIGKDLADRVSKEEGQ